MPILLVLIFSLCALLLNPAQAQYRDSGLEIGILGGTAYDNSTGVEDPQPGLQGRLLVAGPLWPFAQWELGAGYTELRGRDSHSILTPLDLILKLSPFGEGHFIPYIFGGGGVLNYRYDKFPAETAAGTDRNGWVAYVPVGVGAQLRVNSGTQLEVRGTYDHMFSPDVSPAKTRADDDSYWGVLAGVRFRASGGNPDLDGDGLSNRLERSIGTNPRNADSDGDSLTDGKEYHTYKTNPLNRDTDGDGLGDGAEALVHGTDALKTDTDGDGLSDFAEINQYNTSPTKADTDDDGLSDGAEINQYKTDPRVADTDGDGLSDGDEVNKHKTDPLKQDTDGGTIADGLEVERGTNPLDPADDMPATPPPQVLIFELDKPVVLPGIQFEFNKAVIRPESESILIQAYTSLKDHPEIVVEISGHADAVGSDSYNQELSARRAESVRQWMINKGIAANRMTAVGFGESRPIASNETDEGRTKNRRIEFKRTK